MFVNVGGKCLDTGVFLVFFFTDAKCSYIQFLNVLFPQSRYITFNTCDILFNTHVEFLGTICTLSFIIRVYLPKLMNGQQVHLQHLVHMAGEILGCLFEKGDN